MLTEIHFLLTYRCNFECDHCFLYCGPGSPGTFTIQQVDEVLRETQKIETVNMIYFEGGEPTLYYPLLLESVKRAYQYGFEVGIVSNAYGALAEEDARLWLEPLAHQKGNAVTRLDPPGTITGHHQSRDNHVGPERLAEMVHRPAIPYDRLFRLPPGQIPLGLVEVREGATPVHDQQIDLVDPFRPQLAVSGKKLDSSLLERPDLGPRIIPLPNHNLIGLRNGHRPKGHVTDCHGQPPGRYLLPARLFRSQ